MTASSAAEDADSAAAKAAAAANNMGDKMEAAADKGAENPQKSEKDRETSRESARKARHDMAWYLARLELTPDNGQRPAEGFKIYGEFMKLPAEAMLKEIDLITCESSWHMVQADQKKEARGSRKSKKRR